MGQSNLTIFYLLTCKTQVSIFLQFNTYSKDTLQIDFEAFAKVHWSEQEIQHVTLIIDFIQPLMNNHDFDPFTEKYDNHSYTQHNRGVPDGMPASITYVKDFAPTYPEYTYDVKHIYADGNVVIFHAHATLKVVPRGNEEKGLNIVAI